jgi:hypothetical protein
VRPGTSLDVVEKSYTYILPLMRLESRILGYPVRSLVTILTELFLLKEKFLELVRNLLHCYYMWLANFDVSGF